MAFGLFRRSRPITREKPLLGADLPSTDALDDDEEDAPGAKMSFLEHLDELRRRIVVSLAGVLVGCLVSFAFVGRIYDFIMRPLAAMLPQGSHLVFTEPTEGFVLRLKMAVLAGIVLASPVIIWQVWLFISPGLYAREKRVAVPFIVFGTIGFVLGAAFSHYLAFPVTWRFLASFTNEYTMFMPKIESIFSLYAKMMLGLGIVFQMPTAVYFLARIGVVTARFLFRSFKYAVLIIFLVAAVITPTGDPLTQTLFAAPMILLYLVSIAIAWAFGRKREPEPAG